MASTTASVLLRLEPHAGRERRWLQRGVEHRVPHRQVCGGQQVHRAARTDGLHERAVVPERTTNVSRVTPETRMPMETSAADITWAWAPQIRRNLVGHPIGRDWRGQAVAAEAS